MSMGYNCVVILGPTASGKTRLACQLADVLGAEVISADSRQVYQHLNIGTGKDLAEYVVQGKQIPYHMIDVADPHTQFYLHQYVEGMDEAFQSIILKNKWPIICGGTGLYLDALHKDFSNTAVPENADLRAALEKESKAQLLAMLQTYPAAWHEKVDIQSKKRLVRALEIAVYKSQQGIDAIPVRPRPEYRPIYFGIAPDKLKRSDMIEKRLLTRMASGLVEEVKALMAMGVGHERLQRFGLEYKFVSYYLLGQMGKEEMQSNLLVAINQYAKRQMTWFRKMEKEGIQIHWLEEEKEISAQINWMVTLLMQGESAQQ